MSHASTISHYIKIASQGRVLDSGNIVELEDAINALVDEAVARAVATANTANATRKAEAK